MADQYPALLDRHVEFMQQQHLFFVATAAAEGYVNISPKGMDTLRVVDTQKVIWLNLTGSGNETAAHVLENDRMTLMFCSFDRQPLILRLYGNAKVIHADDPAWSANIGRFPSYTGARQLFEITLSLVQTSCGYAVPYFEARGERPTLAKWADNKGRAGIEDYWQAKNTTSLNGKPTGMDSGE
ncbi:MAG: pyridoxamine 5'-phosphate oxidase family protein [Pseudomonadota bacterium]